MSTSILTDSQSTPGRSSEPLYSGLRLTADEYQALPDDGHRYELVDGVVIVSPSPTPKHQSVLMEIARQLANYLDANPVGMVLPETDVQIGKGPTGGDLVYRPEIVFVRKERIPQIEHKIVGSPELVVEVVSPGTRRFDNETKKSDYERCGVIEYWLVDPPRETLTFYRLQAGRYLELPAAEDHFESVAVPGFVLDLSRVRKLFGLWR